MRHTRPLALLAVSTGLAAALSAPAQAADATVSILHGVPGATVDVYANGDAILEDFEPGTLTDPLTLPEGSYDLKVTAAGAGADGAAGFFAGAWASAPTAAAPTRAVTTRTTVDFWAFIIRALL